MKSNIIKTTITALVIFALSGCSGFLDLEPKTNEGTTGNFYKNDTDIEYALTATYASLNITGYYRDYMAILTDVRSDDWGAFSNVGSNAGREYNIKAFLAGSDNAIFREVWRSIYETIYRANAVIKYSDIMKSESLKKQYVAEARFIRALSYFNIVRLWGAAPLILEPVTTDEAAKYGRDDVSKIYAAIEEDLIFAGNASNLPAHFSGDNVGRATSLAAQALLGKVYLTQKKYTETITVLGTLINTNNGGYHSLLPDIANVFSTAPAHGSSAADFKNYTAWNPQIMNSEIIFEILYNKNDATMGRNALAYYCNQGDLNEELKSSSTTCIYDASDRRSDLLLSINGNNNDSKLLVKYADMISSISRYQYPLPILRWADVLLMYAEALNEVGFDASTTSPALNYLNQVRTRSFATGAYSAATLNSQEKFRDAVLLERRLEFPMEMQRWFDLLRTGKAKEAIQKINFTITDKDLLYPIPNSEIALRKDNTNFPQNPGYHD